MKVVYITSTSFFDADLWYLTELGKLVDLTVLLDLPSFSLNQASFQLNDQPTKSGIIPFNEVKELKKFNEFWGNDCFIINRPKAKRMSYETFKISNELHSFLKKLQPDIIHFNNPITQFGFTALKFPAKKIMTIHDPIPHIGELKGVLQIRAKNMKYIQNYLLLNEFQKSAFIAKYKLREDQVFNTFLSSFNRIETKSINDHFDRWNLLFFGRITPYKGLNLLIEAFHQLKNEFPKLSLTIAGKGNAFKINEPMEGVQFIQRYIPATELTELIENAAIVVCPYIEGTQSGVIMTSFGLTKPVIATNVGGFSEMIEQERTGILVEPNNSEALKNAIHDVLSNPEKLNTFSQNIANDYHNNGKKSWRVSAEKTFKAYSSL